MKLKEHQITLQGEQVALRPMTEADWDILLKWNNDPEVLFFAEGDDVSGYSREQIQTLYRGVSQNGFCFIIEVDGVPIGECWLQEVNLERILRKYSESDPRRVDLMIGEKEYWGQGYGTEVIRLLTVLAFEHEQADLVFACDIADTNPASFKAFRKAGYRVLSTRPQPAGGKAQVRYDLVLKRGRLLKREEQGEQAAG